MRLRRRRGAERGAVAMEAALVVPVIMLLVFGMIDMSLMLRDYVSMTAATRTGTRLAVAEADAGPCKNDSTDTTSCPAQTSSTTFFIPEAAQDAADTMQKSLTGVAGVSVKYLLVYEANKNGFPCTSEANCNPNLASPATAADNNSTMPATCAGYVNCLYFKWSPTAAAGAGAFRIVQASSSTTGWKSSTIAACINKEDSIGIYLNLTHQWLTGIFGNGGVTMADKSVMKFEPLPSDTCDSTKVSAHP